MLMMMATISSRIDSKLESQARAIVSIILSDYCGGYTGHEENAAVALKVATVTLQSVPRIRLCVPAVRGEDSEAVVVGVDR